MPSSLLSCALAQNRRFGITRACAFGLKPTTGITQACARWPKTDDRDYPGLRARCPKTDDRNYSGQRDVEGGYSLRFNPLSGEPMPTA